MTTRRGFLGSILAAAVAPAIVRADSLMRIVPRELTVAPAFGGGGAGGASLVHYRPGEILIQWVGDDPMMPLREGMIPSGGFLRGVVAASGDTIPLPAGVRGAWVSCYGAGGGGRMGNMVSPYRDDLGNINCEPIAIPADGVVVVR